MPHAFGVDKSPNFGRLYIFGAGGFGREAAWLAEQTWGGAVECVFLVDRPEYLQGNVNGIPVRLLDDADHEDARFIVAVGDPVARRILTQRCIDKGLTSAILIHPRVEMSQFNHIGEGSVLCAGTIITTGVYVGRHVHINLGCTVGHDARVGDFSTVSPGVNIAGNVHVGEGVFFGVGANVINGVHSRPLVIGDGAVVAAGACVTRDVEPNSMVAGVPAIRKR